MLIKKYLLLTVSFWSIWFFILNCNSSGKQKNGSAVLGLLLLSNNQNLLTSNNSSSCPSRPLPSGVYLADTITSAPNSDSTQPFKDPSKAINGICGAGQYSGSFDVYRLDVSGSGAYVILEWKSLKVTNGTGNDFVVFSNGFQYLATTNTGYFMKASTVEVSRDQLKWCGFNPQYIRSPATSYSTSKSDWLNFAGLTPVLYNQDTNTLTATEIFNQTLAGGDQFDLSNLSNTNNSASGTSCDAAEISNIQNNGFYYIKITTAGSRINPNTGSNFPMDAGSYGTGSTVDGILARYTSARP